MISTQLEAGLRRHSEKPYVPGKVVYEDDRIIVTECESRGGMIRTQVNKPKPDELVAFIYLPAA